MQLAEIVRDIGVKYFRTLGTQVAPRHLSYRGGWTSVMVCEKCGRAVLYEDESPIHPCNECGAHASLREKLRGRWRKEVSGSWWKFNRQVEYFWEIKK